jgi:hypothetical protein
MKKLYKFHVSCGRMGSLQGIFTWEETEVAGLIGKRVGFGEILGKHSDISLKIEPDHIIEVPCEASFIEKFDELQLSNGTNPFAYLDE